MPEVDIKFSMFFDKPKVMRAVRDGTKSVLSKAGAFIRTSARSSIRKRKGVAQAGKPPSSHTGRLRDLIFFGYDDQSDTVVVGPLLFKSQTPTPPNVLEFGGKVRTPAGKQATYRKFPFMAPALAANQSKFPELFRGAIKG